MGIIDISKITAAEVDAKIEEASVGYAPVISVTTEDRPSSGLIAGQCVFDTTIGKPIWWNGTAWVDSTGTNA